ncbi:hypothetical protein ACFWNG_11060 [Streptomyces sp. NPDC058391]|uniref:hypothetical protein n=1 Tax=Streptomyces sp. NPDC058391 TaxID=3346476 RepID=UPI00366537DC
MTTRQMPEPTAYDRRMYALMNKDEGRSFYATAARRRGIVCAHIALTALGAAAWIMVGFSDQRWALFALVGVVLPWCVATGLINSATRGLLELRGRVLDERQRAERHRVQARAHRATSFLLLAGALAASAVGWLGEVQAEVRVEVLLAPVLVGVLVVHWMMPLWVAGLLVEDEPTEELIEE